MAPSSFGPSAGDSLISVNAASRCPNQSGAGNATGGGRAMSGLRGGAVPEPQSTVIVSPHWSVSSITEDGALVAICRSSRCSSSLEVRLGGEVP